MPGIFRIHVRTLTSAIGLTLTFLLTAGAGTPLLAADHVTCEAYAKNAVKQTELKLGRQCGTNPNDRSEWWSLDEGYHYRWCRGVSQPNLLTDGTKNRDAVIDQCTARVDEATCVGYADTAVQQNEQRLRLGCTSNIGRSDMWSSDTGYHLRWCRGQTDRNLLANGQQARADALLSCVPTGEPNIACSASFGLRKPVKVQKYITRATLPSDGGVATCIYDFGGGNEIRADAKWKQAVGWRVTVPVSEGCDPASAGIGSTKTTEGGLSASSAKFHASASVRGNTPAMFPLAQAAHGALTEMFVLAEQNALPCR